MLFCFITARSCVNFQNLNTKACLVQMYSTKSECQPQTHDIIGKPDPVSNLRPYRFHIPISESSIEKQYREEREKVQIWNQEFWLKHNLKFSKVRVFDFLTSLGPFCKGGNNIYLFLLLWS